jgi:hypothetical protein
MVGFLIGGALLLSLGEDERGPDATTTDRPAPTEAPAGSNAPGPAQDAGARPGGGRLPDGALPPILDEPATDRLAYCDARNWARLDAFVREVRDGELIVEEPAWQAAGASAQAGLAGWASKCRLDGAALAVRSAQSGRRLGDYAPDSGYAPTD